MSVAGYTEEVYVRTDTTAPSASDMVDGITEFNFQRSSEMEETTDFADQTGYKTRIQKLKDSSIDMSGQYESGDAPQGVLRTGWENGTTVHVTVYVDPAASAGSRGWRIPCLVESYTAQGQVGGVGQFSARLVGNGAPTAV